MVNLTIASSCFMSCKSSLISTHSTYKSFIFLTESHEQRKLKPILANATQEVNQREIFCNVHYAMLVHLLPPSIQGIYTLGHMILSGFFTTIFPYHKKSLTMNLSTTYTTACSSARFGSGRTRSFLLDLFSFFCQVKMSPLTFMIT